jgi:hypothetical protein
VVLLDTWRPTAGLSKGAWIEARARDTSWAVEREGVSAICNSLLGQVGGLFLEPHARDLGSNYVHTLTTWQFDLCGRHRDGHQTPWTPDPFVDEESSRGPSVTTGAKQERGAHEKATCDKPALFTILSTAAREQASFWRQAQRTTTATLE